MHSLPLRALSQRIAGVLLAILCIGSSLHGQEGPGQEIVQANQSLRQTVTAAMQKAARNTGAALLADKLVIGSRNDVLVVNAALEGVTRVTIADLEGGAPLMFVYLNLPQGMEVARGFYTVKVMRHRTQRGAWVAQLLDAKGVVVRELGATVATGEPVLPEGKLTVSITISRQGVVIDIRFGGNAVDVAFSGSGTGSGTGE